MDTAFEGSAMGTGKTETSRHKILSWEKCENLDP